MRVTIWKAFIMNGYSFWLACNWLSLTSSEGSVDEASSTGEKKHYPYKVTYTEVGLYSTIQIPSGYYLQTMNSNLNFSGFVLPIAAMNVISIVPLLILVPILECINSYLFSSKGSGHPPTMYIGKSKICLWSFDTYFCFERKLQQMIVCFNRYFKL